MHPAAPRADRPEERPADGPGPDRAGAGLAGVWLDPAEARVDDLAALCRAGATQPGPPHADALVQGIPRYEGDAVRRLLAEPATRRALSAEWHGVLAEGAGVLLIARAWADAALVEAVTAEFHALIEAERAGHSGGDHFGAAGASSRVWNALQKLALRAPRLFADYYANEALAAVCEAWLGPAWQMTSQVNCVNPGGPAQTPHRDYHLGFAVPAQAARFPAAVHRLSPALTLQGAVAHVDMPPQTGPTLLLPHSHKFLPGYLVAGQPAFDAYFAAHHVQLPLARGDAVFFNPALMHAAGANRTGDVRRMGNLLQVSSAFGRAMEAIDRPAICRAVYPVLREDLAAGRIDSAQAERVVAVCAEGYAFPTNLDRDPPLGGLAPASHQDLMRQALREGWPEARFAAALAARCAVQQP